MDIVIVDIGVTTFLWDWIWELRKTANKSDLGNAEIEFTFRRDYIHSFPILETHSWSINMILINITYVSSFNSLVLDPNRLQKKTIRIAGRFSSDT